MQPAAAAPAPGPSARVSVALIVIGLLTGGATLFKIVPAVVTTFTSQHVILAPGSTPVQLHPGKYVVFERTGTRSGGGGFTFENRNAPDIGPEQVSVTAPNGEPVAVTSLGDTSETITRGSAEYTGTAEFRAATTGEYVVQVTSEPRQALVARSIGDTFGSVAGWFLVALLGGMIVVLGVILMIVGIVRRNRAANRAGYAPPPGPAAPWPPPDWPNHPPQDNP